MTSAARSWKPYSAYKDSGVEWLGKVPEGWKVQKLKNIVKVNLSNVDKKKIEGEDTVKLCNYVDVYYNDYITSNLDFMEATASPDQIDKFALRGGDVIITKDSESWDDIAVPAYVPADLKSVICGYHLAHIRPNNLNIDGEYLFWSLCAPQVNHQFRIEAHGITRFGIGKYSIDNSLILVPSINDQKYIVRFLEDRTQKIDFLIEKKQKVIEFLKEERAAVINHAVTKGLDPRAPMRDSGVEWLGEVPEGWEMKPFRRICSLNQGLQKAQSERFFESGENRFEYITIKSINNPDNPKEYIENPPKSVICKPDDVLLARTGATGEVITNQSGVFHNNFFLVNYNPKTVFKNFLVYYLQNSAIKDHLLMLAGTTTIPDLNHSDFLSTLFLLPPFEEQVKIVKFIESETSRIDRATSTIEKEIALLQEYRTALISEVVTGKIDVCGEC